MRIQLDLIKVLVITTPAIWPIAITRAGDDRSLFILFLLQLLEEKMAAFFSLCFDQKDLDRKERIPPISSTLVWIVGWTHKALWDSRVSPLLVMRTILPAAPIIGNIVQLQS